MEATGNVEHQAVEVSLVSPSLKGQGQGHLRITKEDAPLSSDHKPGESATPEQLLRIRKLKEQGMREDLAREEVLGKGWGEP